VQAFDAGKHRAAPLVADARETLAELSPLLHAHQAPPAWTRSCQDRMTPWRDAARAATAAPAPMGNQALPSDAQVIGAVQRAMPPDTIVVAAAGGVPGELHKLWNATGPGTYHLEYGYSCMGYEIAGGLGVKLAMPDRDVVVLLGDGSWLMMNSEIATAVMLGLKLVVVLLDNGGFGCIDRLQRSTGAAGFNNLLRDSRQAALPRFDFAAQAAGLGAIALPADGVFELEAALVEARTTPRTTVIVVRTDPAASTAAGGAWWDVAVPEVSTRPAVRDARAAYERQLKGE